MSEGRLSSAKFWLTKARSLIYSAELLRDSGFHEDAVARAHYAIFHAGCALMASIGKTVRTRDDLRAAISENFIRGGMLPQRFARILAHAAADRDDAEFNLSAIFEAEHAAEAIASARDLIGAAEQLIARNC